MADPTGEQDPLYWQTLSNLARRRKATVNFTKLEDLEGGRRIWTFTVLYDLGGTISSWTVTAPDLKAAREAAARKALLELLPAEDGHEQGASASHRVDLAAKDAAARKASLELSPGFFSADDRQEHSTSAFHRVDLVRQLECLQTEAIPATREIVTALLALAKAIPKVIRNKHKIYRVFLCLLETCAEIHEMPKRGNESTNWIRVLDDITETLDSLTQVVPNIVQLVSQEMIPFELSSLQTWNHSCETLKSITEELSKHAVRPHQVSDDFEAKKDQHFDDCSWLSRIFQEGIVAAIQRTYRYDDNIPTEVKKFVDRLEGLMDEVKLMDQTNDSIRVVVIRITSDIARVAIKSLSATTTEFWIAASDALQLVKPDDGFTQDLVDSLILKWGRFSELWITSDGALHVVVTQVSEQDSSTFSLSEDFVHLKHEPTSATEQVVLLLKEIGKAAISVRRHKHKVYSIVRRARDICDYLLSLGERPENQQPTGADDLLGVLDEYFNIIEALEGELRKFSEILIEEKAAYGPDGHSTWSQSRAAIIDIQAVLNREPFNVIPSKPGQDAVKDSLFDDCSWISFLLHDDVEPAIARQFPNPENVPEAFLRVKESLNHIENEIKQGNHEETFRQLTIDILTRLSETLSTPPSTNAASLAREDDPSAPRRVNQHWLLESLSDACSAINLHSELRSTDIEQLGQKWSEISSALGLGRGGRMSGEDVRGLARPDELDQKEPPKPVKLASPVVEKSHSPKAEDTPIAYGGSSPYQQYHMQLNVIEQNGWAKFSFEAEPTGPLHKPTWKAVVTVTSIAPSLANSIFIGTARQGHGPSKTSAKDVACQQMLSLFTANGVLPKIGQVPVDRC